MATELNGVDSKHDIPCVFAGEGEMAGRVNTHDWAGTPLGPVAGWPDSIRSAVGIALAAPFPIVVLSGPDLVAIYNDAAICLFGERHPWALGKPAAQVWFGAWPALAPILQSVRASGRALRHDDPLLVLQREGECETACFTFSYSPIPSLGGCAGVCVSALDASERLVCERRPAGLDALSSGSLTRVLVVGGHLDSVRQFERMLAPWCQVAAAADAAGALEALRREPPDIVLLDLMAAGTDGLGLLRADAALQWIPLIVLSARDGEDARVEALAAGADDILAQPFSARELSAMVHAHVNLACMRRAAIEREAGLQSQIAEVRGDLASVTHGSGDAFLNVDRELRIVAVKKSDPPMTTLPADQLIGQVLTDVAPEFGPVGTALRRAMREQRAVGLHFLHTPSKRWFSVRCYPGGDGAIAFASEITRRKTAEAQLKQANAELEMRVRQRTRELNSANALLEAVFERSPAGIVMADFDGRIVRANAAFERLVGLSGAQLRALNIEQLADPPESALNQALLDQLRAGEADTFLTEMRYRHPDGSLTWVENFVGTIDGEDGRPRYIVKIVQDISSRKAAADEILASRNELRFLYDWLQHVRKDERLALAREVHDQLGQILSAAKIDIKLLLDDVLASSAGLPRRKLVAELSSASDTLDQAIESARSIAVQLRPPEIDSQGLYAALDWHARDFERRTRVRVELDLPAPAGGPTCAGAAALFRILQEALTNILRHARATCVAISVRRRGRRMLLRVRDNGMGIAPGRVRQAGTLGLVGMRERAALVGGRVAIRRLASGGTLLSALLPVSDFRET